MYPWLAFIIIPFSLVAGAYGIILLNRLRRKYRLNFLDSFFYFQLLLFVFGLYGILGSLGMRQILDLFELKTSQVEVIAQFIPFLGVPFIIAAWYMSLKMAYELVDKRISQLAAITYFSLCTVGFLIYGLLIRQMPSSAPGDFENLSHQIRLFFFAIELGIVAYIALRLLSHKHRKKNKKREEMISRFAGIFVLTTILTAITQYFADKHFLLLLYFLLLYFAGDLPLVLLIKNHLEKHTPPTSPMSTPWNICIKNTAFPKESGKSSGRYARVPPTSRLQKNSSLHYKLLRIIIITSSEKRVSKTGYS